MFDNDNNNFISVYKCVFSILTLKPVSIPYEEQDTVINIQKGQKYWNKCLIFFEIYLSTGVLKPCQARASVIFSGNQEKAPEYT